MLMSAPLLGRLLAFPPNAAAALGSCHYSLILTLLRRQSRVSDFVAIFVFVVWENNFTLLLSTGCLDCATLKSPCTGCALSTQHSSLHFLSLFFSLFLLFVCRIFIPRHSQLAIPSKHHQLVSAVLEVFSSLSMALSAFMFAGAVVCNKSEANQ